MKIFRAVKTNIASQLFGKENTKPSILYIYKEAGLEGHEGIDFAITCINNTVKTGGQCEPIYCDVQCKSLKVYKVSTSTEYGFGIALLSEDEDGLFEHLYWHLDSVAPNLKVGDTIDAGTFLGTGGNTGRSTGAHLHRGLREMGRDTYGNLYIKNPNNGYAGWQDFTKYYINEFVVDKIKNLQTQVSVLQKLVLLLKKLLNK